jgi:hypothetical protein
VRIHRRVSLRRLPRREELQRELGCPSERPPPSLHTTMVVRSRPASIRAVATQYVLEPCWPNEASGARTGAQPGEWLGPRPRAGVRSR